MGLATVTFPKKTVYHSALRDAGPLTVAFTSEVRPSKYSGKPPYVEFKVEGDDSEYQYNIENDGIAALIKDLPQNEWVEIEATGSREEADIQVVTNGIPASPTPTTRSAPVARQQPAAPQPEASGDSLARILWRCLEVSAQLTNQFEEKMGRPMTEHDRAIAISLAIEVHRGNKLPLSR